MSSRVSRTLLALTHAGVLATLAAATACQCRINQGPLKPNQRARVPGDVTRSSPLLDTLRHIDYAVTGDYYDLEAQGCPAPGVVLSYTTGFKGLELERGFTYVKISDPSANAAGALLPGAEEVVGLTLDEPTQYLPLVLAELRRDFSMRTLESAAWSNVAEQLQVAIEAARANEELRELLASGKPIAGPFSEAVFDIARLVTSLTSPTTSAADRQTLAILIVLRLAINSPDLSRLTLLTKYPFVVSRRTIGGAEGTEIVVYVHEDPGSPNLVEVYYFYMWSAVAKNIDVCAFRVVDGVEIKESLSIGVGSYAMVPLSLQDVGGVQKWCRRDPWEFGQINAIAQGSAAHAAFGAAVPAAYLHACQVGIHPRSPLDYLGARLQCP